MWVLSCKLVGFVIKDYNARLNEYRDVLKQDLRHLLFVSYGM